MKRNNKKGFTIVELTIVIAVIAILAAVLIPTFSSIVDKANTSSDIQLVRQANVILAALDVYGEEIDEATAKDELLANGIDISAEPANSNNSFHYIPEKKFYVVFDVKQEKIIFPEDLATELSGWKPSQTARIGNQYYATLKEAVSGAKDGDTVIVLKDIETTEQVIINKNITIDFNKHTYNVTGMVNDDTQKKAFNIDAGATVQLSNGTIKMLSGAYCVISIPKGQLTVTDMKIDASSTDKFRTVVYAEQGSFTMNNTVLSSKYEYPILVENNSTFELTINGKSSLDKTIVLRYKTIKVTVNSDLECKFAFLADKIPTTLTMKLAKGDYPSVNGYTWSEPDKDGYRTLTKNS